MLYRVHINQVPLQAAAIHSQDLIDMYTVQHAAVEQVIYVCMGRIYISSRTKALQKYAAYTVEITVIIA